MHNFDIEDIQNKIGYKFKNLDFLFTAFTHASYANERSLPSNERYEFLGDSILNFIVARRLFEMFPLQDEGFLTKARAKIVSARPLATAIERCGVSKYLRHAQGAIGDNGASAKVKSRLFEAVTGAIMLDGGIKPTEEFIFDKLGFAIKDILSEDNLSDYKSRLIEDARRENKTAVFVTDATKDGEDGFYSTVYIDSKACGTGRARSKKKAEQLAAKAVYCKDK